MADSLNFFKENEDKHIEFIAISSGMRVRISEQEGVGLFFELSPLQINMLESFLKHV